MVFRRARDASGRFVSARAATFTASPSISTQDSSTSNPTASIPPTEFIRFPDLPTELRLVIWYYACTPRLVIWGYSGANQKLLAVCQTNQEAREATEGPYHFYKRPPGHIKGKTYLLLVNMEKDVLYRRCALPKSKVEFYDRGEVILPPPCKASDWMRDIRHLAINLDDAASDDRLWDNLAFMCPRLKELIIVCGPKPKRGNGDTLDDFVETTVVEEAKLGDYNERRMMMMEAIECGLDDEKNEGLSENLELTFLKKKKKKRPASANHI